MKRHSDRQRNSRKHISTEKVCSILYQDGQCTNLWMLRHMIIFIGQRSCRGCAEVCKRERSSKSMLHKGNVFSVEPPLFVELAITETEPGFKGDTAQGATKVGNS